MEVYNNNAKKWNRVKGIVGIIVGTVLTIIIVVHFELLYLIPIVITLGILVYIGSNITSDECKYSDTEIEFYSQILTKRKEEDV